ncbi:MAG: helix-turn-helix domain-containing protein [Solirubrobacterales bacterium]|nr:helix-turn-helix domain-containing protein [Solirubrobacterales bacterium]
MRSYAQRKKPAFCNNPRYTDRPAFLAGALGKRNRWGVQTSDTPRIREQAAERTAMRRKLAERKLRERRRREAIERERRAIEVAEERERARELKQKRRERIGLNILRLREAAGMSQQDLAVLIGDYREHISKWEHGREEPDAGHLAQLMEVFDVEEGEFFKPIEPEAAAA